MSINRLDCTFRLAFIRRKIRTTFKSQAVRTALLAELDARGPDSEVIIRMVEKIPTIKRAAVQPVQPIPKPVQPAAVQPIPDQPAQLVADGNSEESALEVQDPEDELVQDMTLSPRSEQRLRRQLQLWRERLSSSSD